MTDQLCKPRSRQQEVFCDQDCTKDQTTSYKLSKACTGTEWVLTGKLITRSFNFFSPKFQYLFKYLNCPNPLLIKFSFSTSADTGSSVQERLFLLSLTSERQDLYSLVGFPFTLSAPNSTKGKGKTKHKNLFVPTRHEGKF